MNRIYLLNIIFGLFFQMNANAKQKSTVFIIGVSTVKSGQGKGASPIVLSMIPRNEWKEGKVERASEMYGKWAKEEAGKLRVKSVSEKLNIYLHAQRLILSHLRSRQ